MLHTRITGALGHNIKELPVGLGVQLIKHHAVDIKAVFTVGFCRKHLIKTIGRSVNDTLGGRQDFDAPVERRTHPDHIGCHFKNDGCLLTIRSTAVDLCTLLTVAACEQERHRSGQLRLAHLLGYLNVGGVELSVAVGLERSEDIPDDLLLPVNQLEGLSGPCAFGVAQTLYEADRIIRSVLIVIGILGGKLRRFIFLQLTDSRSPPSKKHKNKPPKRLLP